jgi:hypothetical protein
MRELLAPQAGARRKYRPGGIVMKKRIVAFALIFSATAAFAGQKIAGARETTIDEPFCAG